MGIAAGLSLRNLAADTEHGSHQHESRKPIQPRPLEHTPPSSNWTQLSGRGLDEKPLGSASQYTRREAKVAETSCDSDALTLF